MSDQAVKSVAVGQSVTLNVPENHVLHGIEAKVVAPTNWGAIVSTGIGSGYFRAAWSEMVEIGRPPVAVPPTNGLVKVGGKLSGYTGDCCDRCGGCRMRRNGSCLLCEDCGSTSGCS